MKKLLALLAIALLISLVLFPAPSVSSAEAELTFNIAEARAYAYRISLNEEVFRLASCNKQTDPYQCDNNRYNQAPNCPPARRTEVAATPPPGGKVLSGGAGFQNERTSGKEPHKANPVKINELVTTGSLTKAGTVAGASGSASDTFTDNSGRDNPEAHAESDATIPNKNRREERCQEPEASSYIHVLSRSETQPETYSLTECIGENRCSESAIGYRRPSAGRAFSVISLYQEGGKVFGRLKAFVSNMSFGSGPTGATVESMTTYLSFESDGTRAGLKWSAVSTASGVTAFGQPVPLESGQTVEAPGGAAFIGIVGPYVVANNAGTQLMMIAPGLFYSTNDQTTYVAGSEVRAGFGRSIPFSFLASQFNSGNPGLGLIRPGPQNFGDETAALGTDGVLPTAPDAGEPPVLSIRRLATAPWPLASMIAAAGLALLVLLAGWMQRFPVARKLFRLQPLRSLNWMYRAFVRT
jgi:hypothetical protein